MNGPDQETAAGANQLLRPWLPPQKRRNRVREKFEPNDLM